eukprot:gene5850-6443_t
MSSLHRSINAIFKVKTLCATEERQHQNPSEIQDSSPTSTTELIVRIMTCLSFFFILVVGVTAVMASNPINLTAADDESCSITEYVLALQDICGDITIHGLWPDPENTCTSCTSEKFFTFKLSSSTLDGMKKYWPNCLKSKTNEDFWSHEWSKHGTCTGMSQDAYFSKALSLYSSYSSKCTSTCDLCYSPNFYFKGDCKSIPVNPKTDEIPKVDCGNQAAMRSMCAFSVFMFLSYLVQVATLIHFKNDILGAAPANESVGNRDGIPSFIISKPSNASTLPPSLPTPPSDSGSLSFDHSYKAPILPNQIPQQASLPPTLPFEHNSDYPNTADL